MIRPVPDDDASRSRGCVGCARCVLRCVWRVAVRANIRPCYVSGRVVRWLVACFAFCDGDE